LAVNAKKTNHMSVYRDQNAGQYRNIDS